MHQGQPQVQPPRCARCHLGDGTAELYPAGARTRQGLRRGLAGHGGRRRRLSHPRVQPPCPPPRATPMPELLLELFSEEIPARMQAKAADDLRRLVTDALANKGVHYEGASAYATPRRLALTVHGVPARQPDMREERKGPRVGAPQGAIDGFLR